MPDNLLSPDGPVERADLGVSRFLAIHVDGDRFGLPLEQVREVVRAVWVTPLPGAPSVVMGLIDVRGHFVPVFDMRRRFGRPSPPIDPAERFVIAWTGTRQIAIRADLVPFSFDAVPEQGIEPVSDVLRPDAFITGLAHTPEGVLLIQDLRSFLTESESDSLETALTAFLENAGRA